MNLMSNGNKTSDKPDDVKTYQAPPEGSLGLLALGWKGLKFWREAREAAKKRIHNEQKS
jgi:hypothetical protein